MKHLPLNQRVSPRVPLTPSPRERVASRLAAERGAERSATRFAREADECLVGRFSTRLPRALSHKI